MYKRQCLLCRRRTSTRTTRWLRAKEKTFGDRCRTSRAAAREAKIPAASSSVWPLSRAITLWIRDGSLIAAHNMLWVLWLLWGRPHNSHNTHNMLWAAMREPSRIHSVMARERGHTELLAAGIFASRAAAREVRHRSPNVFSFALSQRVVRVLVLRRHSRHCLLYTSPSPRD